MDNCANCRFVKKPALLTKHEGQCRRNPPTAQMIPAGGGQAQIMTFHPTVKFTDWCGCHEPQPMEFTLEECVDLAKGLIVKRPEDVS